MGEGVDVDDDVLIHVAVKVDVGVEVGVFVDVFVGVRIVVSQIFTTMPSGDPLLSEAWKGFWVEKLLETVPPVM